MAKNILDRFRLVNTGYLNELKDLVELQGGKLLSTEWLGNNKPHDFAFPDGVVFSRTALAMKINGWPNDQYTYLRSTGNKGRGAILLSDMSELAEANGGKLLSTKWLGDSAHHEFKFEDGTEFTMIPSNLKTRGWPKNKDAFLRRGRSSPDKGARHLEDMRKIAQDNGGKLLSTEWLGATNPHEFEFGDGIIFSMTPDKLKGRGWPKDQDVYFRNASNPDRGLHLLEHMCTIAESNGGKLISDEWNGATEFYLFEDRIGLQFEITYSSLKAGGWSTDRGLVSEPVCRQAMKHLFDTGGQDSPKFNPTRRVVIRDGQYPLELDGYDEASKARPYAIAFEYQGDPSHHVAGKVKDRDKEKKYFCDTHNIVLVVIPPFRNKNSWESTYVIGYVKEAVEQAFKDAFKKEAFEGLSMPELNKAEFKVDMNIHGAVEKLEELRTIAEANGGKLISREWLGNDKLHEFEFEDGTLFSIRPGNLKSRGWPIDIEVFLRIGRTNPEKAATHLEDMRQIVDANGGKLISREWLGNDKPHEFAFEDGTLFSIRPSNLKTRGWPKDQDRYMKHLERLKQESQEDIASEEQSDEEYEDDYVLLR